jgi:hypothetical protein
MSYPAWQGWRRWLPWKSGTIYFEKKSTQTEEKKK